MEMLEQMMKEQLGYLEKFSNEEFKQKLLDMKVSEFARLLPNLYGDLNITKLKNGLNTYFGDCKLNKIVRNPRQLLGCSNMGPKSYKYLEKILMDLGLGSNKKLSEYTKEELLKMEVLDFVRIMPEAQDEDRKSLTRLRNVLLKEYKDKTVGYVVKNLKPNCANNFGEVGYRYFRKTLQDIGIYDACDKV